MLVLAFCVLVFRFVAKRLGSREFTFARPDMRLDQFFFGKFGQLFVFLQCVKSRKCWVCVCVAAKGGLEERNH